MGIDLSIIIPTFNEESMVTKSVQELVAHLEHSPITAEIIVVNDGSTSPDYLKSTCLPKCVRVIHNDRNRGKGYSIKNGLRTARGKVQIFYDNDLPFGLEVLDKVYDLVRNYRYDFVAGVRDSKTLASRGMVRQWLSGLLNQVLNRFLIGDRLDSQCGIKGFSKKFSGDVLSHSVVNRFAFDIEIYFMAKKLKVQVVQVPVAFVSDAVTNPSSIKLVRDSFISLVELVYIPIHWYSNHALQWFKGRRQSEF